MSDLASSTTFVGRHPEQLALLDAWARAADGTASIVLIGGEAGIGKSRLLRQLADEVTRSDGQWLLGGCTSQAGSVQPFGPLVAALRSLARRVGTEELQRLVGPSASDLTRLLPELDADVPEAVVADRFTTSSGRLFEQVLGLLHRLAAEQPLALVLEDLHWADPSTLDLLDFLARNLIDERILLVATYRTDELHRRHPLRPALAELHRIGAVSTLGLSPLTEHEVAELLGSLLGIDVDPTVVAMIAARSGGVPFFVEELAMSVDDLDQVPPELEEMLRTRIDALDPDVQELLRAVAAGAGYAAVPHRLLLQVTGLEESELIGRLRDAVSHQVLVVNDDAYDFRHALMREVVDADLLPGESATLHAAYAQALTDRFGEDVEDASIAARIAHHWYDAGDMPRCARASYLAGRAAERAYAFAEASHQHERVLRLWDQIDGPEMVVPQDRLDVATHAVRSLMLGGAQKRAIGLGAAELERDAAEHPVHRGERRGNLMATMGRAIRTTEGSEPSAAMLREALAEFPDETSHARTLVMCELAMSLTLALHHDEALGLAEQALGEAERLDDPITMSRAYNALSILAIGRDEVDEALHLIDRALQEALRSKDADSICRAYVNYSDALRQCGRFEEAGAKAAEGVEFTSTTGMRLTTGAFIHTNGAEALVSLGRLLDVLGTLDDLPPELEYDGHVHGTMVRAWTLIRLGRPDGVLESIESTVKGLRLMADSSYRSVEFRNRAELAFLVGDADAATAAIDEALGRDGSPGAAPTLQYVPELCQLGVRAEVERLLDPLRSPDDATRAAWLGRARELDERAQSLAGRRGSSLPAPLAAALASAEHSRVEATTEAGEQAWHVAIGEAARWQDPWHGAYAELRLAEAILDRPRPDLVEATAAAKAAYVHATRIAAGGLVDEVRDLARRARLELDPSPSGRTAADDGSGATGPAVGGDATERTPFERLGLTPREADVLALLADGRTNREIASELYISPKTASVHVSNILAKLDVRTRTQAAAIAHRALTSA